MTIQMALFGLVWLLRVRGAACSCAACRRARVLAADAPEAREHGDVERGDGEADVADAPRPLTAVVCDVAAARTCDVTVQTDFTDDDDLDVLHELSSLEIKDTESTAATFTANATTSPPTTFDSSFQTNTPYNNEEEDDKESIWEYEDVTLYRDELGLGFSITGGSAGNPIGSKSDSEVRITRIADDGAAARHGKLKLDDVILQVNGTSVVGAPHSVAVDTLQKAGNCVTMRVRRARGVRHVTLSRGIWPGSNSPGFGLGVAGGRDCPRRRGDPAVYVTHVAPQLTHKLTKGDRILAVRDELYGERLLLNVTHAEAVDILQSASDKITLVITPVSREPGVQYPTHSEAASERGYSQRSQATSCSTLHELVDSEEILDIPRYIRVVKLQRSGSKLGMDIMGGGGCEDSNWQHDGEMEPSVGVFVSRCALGGAADGHLHRGDRILSVDGQDLTTATHEQAAAALKCTGPTVVIEAQYQPEEYARLRAKIRALNIKASEQGLFNR